LTLDTRALEAKISDLWVRADLARVGIRGAMDIAGMLQTGGGALDEVLAGATVNTDDNGFVEFAAPKALYLDTQDANLAMLQGTGRDPVTPIAALIRTPENPDRLRLELIRRWLRRNQESRATRAAGFLQDTNLKSEADALLRATR
jgi:hypothetical protein